MVARYVRDVEVPGSNPGSPTRIIKRGTIWCPSFIPNDSVRMVFGVETIGFPTMPQVVANSSLTGLCWFAFTFKSTPNPLPSQMKMYRPK